MRTLARRWWETPRPAAAVIEDQQIGKWLKFAKKQQLKINNRARIEPTEPSQRDSRTGETARRRYR
jgi:hypothetical protein